MSDIVKCPECGANCHRLKSGNETEVEFFLRAVTNEEASAKIAQLKQALQRMKTKRMEDQLKIAELQNQLRQA